MSDFKISNPFLTGELTVPALNTSNVFIGDVNLTSNPTGVPYTFKYPPTLPEVGQFLSVENITNNFISTTWADISTGQVVNSLTVSKAVEVAGVNYNTLTSAVAYINTQTPGPANRWSINVKPGFYMEPDTVDVPSFVTITGDFSLSVVIQTAGTGHIIHASNRTDIYNLVLQGPVSSGKAGIFLDDVGIGMFIGNCRFVSCYYGILAQPTTNKTVYLYARNSLFNDNEENSIFFDSSASNSYIYSFTWNNVYYAPSADSESRGPMIVSKGVNCFHKSFSDDFERDASNVLGKGYYIESGAQVHIKTPVFNWFDTAIESKDDDSSSEIKIIGPTFVDCTKNILINDETTTGYFFGESPYSKITYPVTSSTSTWFVANNNKRIITVGSSGENNFSTISDAISFINALSTPPSGSNRFEILLDVGIHAVSSTLTLPDHTDMRGISFSQTAVRITTINTNLFIAGYDSAISNLSMYGYGTNDSGTNINTPNDSTASGILYQGTTTFTNIGYIRSVQFVNFRFPLNVQTASSKYNILQCQDLRFIGYVNTEICVNVIANGVTAISVDGARYSPTLFAVSGNLYPGVFTHFCKIVADSNTQVNSNLFNNVNLRFGGTSTNVAGGPPLYAGIGFEMQQGDLTIRNCLIKQYVTGLYIPNQSTTPNITFVSSVFTTIQTPISIQNPSASGTIQGVADKSTISIASNMIALLITNPDGDGTTIGGNFYQSVSSVISPTGASPSNITPQINQVASVGLLDGGVISILSGPYRASITAGNGYVMSGVFPDDYLKYVVFDSQTVTLTANSQNFIAIDSDGKIGSFPSVPNTTNYISLGMVMTQTSGQPIYYQQTRLGIVHLAQNINTSISSGLGPIVVSGMITTNSGLQVSISSGSYYVGSKLYSPATIDLGTSFTTLYSGAGSLPGGWLLGSSLTSIPLQWNNSGTLTNITVGKFVKHFLYMSGDTTNQVLFFIYGTQQYDSQSEAEAGSLVTAPSFFTTSVISLSGIVVSSSAIVSILDLRPVFITRLNTVTSTNNHSNLLNLGADDHKQYLLVSGSREMAGNLSLGSNNITNVGTVNSVVVETHASRHLPSGADPLPVATPVTISTSNSQGVAASFALSDHVHAHGNQTSETLHAVATTGFNGFMSSTDKTKLDNSTSSDSLSTLMQRNSSGRFSSRAHTLYDSTGAEGVTIASSTGTTPYTLYFPSSTGTSSQFLMTDGTGITSWNTITPSVITGIVPISKGGTNSSTALNNNRIMTSVAGSIVEAPALTNGQLLIGSTGNSPTGSAITAGTGMNITNGAGSISLAITNTTVTAGSYGIHSATIDAQGRITTATTIPIVAVANGGTNSSTVLNNNRIMTSVAGSIVEAPALTNGQLLIGSTGNSPTGSAITAGTGINITNGAGSITINQIQNTTNPETYTSFFEDFTGNPADTTWISTATNSTIATVTPSVGNFIGCVSLTNANNANSLAIYRKDPVSLYFGIGTFQCKIAVLFPTLSTASVEYICRVGFGDTTTSADNADGIYFEYNRASTGNFWVIKTASASSRTSTTSAIAVTANTWYKLQFNVNAGGTSVTFLINDVSAGTITTTIPTTTSNRCGPSIQMVRSASTGGSIYVDYFAYTYYLTSNRY